MMAATAGTVEERSAAKRFWSRSWKEAVFAAYTPFVVCLAAGNLELDVFRRYIAQDVHFLRSFARAYEMAAEYADDDDDKAAILGLRKATLKELKLHDSVMKEWGIDPEKEIVPEPATVKYTDFLLATAQGKFGGEKSGKIVTPFEKTKIAAYAVGAMTPCMSLYSHLGKEMESLLPHHGDHFYKKWISSYSSKDFEAAAVQIEELLDKVSVSLTGEELDFIEKLYRQAMKLETEFFSAQPITQAAVVPFTKLHDPTKRLFVFCDFDLTCAVVDSSTILAEIAILTASKADQKTDPTVVDARKTSSDMRKSWEALSRQYIEEYDKCIADLLAKEEVKMFDYSVLYKSLEELSKFEKHANLRTIESGLLSGVNLDDIRRAGERMKFHDGCSEFFQKIVKKKNTMSVEFHIISYCWCADLIRAAFSSVGCLNDLNIHSNEFNFEDAISTGKIVTKMESPLDKVEAFTNIINEQSNESQLSVYIGDSVADLLCLLKADVGIVFGSSESLRTVGKQFGVSFIPLYLGLVMKQRQLADKDNTMWRGLSGVLYTVASWTEIQAFLLGA